MGLINVDLSNIEPSQDPLNKVIPELAERAFKEAFKEALESGNVICVKDNYLVSMKQDGSYTRLKPIKPPIQVDLGVKYTLK